MVKSAIYSAGFSLNYEGSHFTALKRKKLNFLATQVAYLLAFKLFGANGLTFLMQQKRHISVCVYVLD
jgi:hypothetical protein